MVLPANPIMTTDFLKIGLKRSSDRQACPYPGALTQTFTNLELATIQRTGRIDRTAAGSADAAAQSNAAWIAGAFSGAGPQKGTTAGPDDGQTQTPHLLRLILGEPNIPVSAVGFVVGTTGAALLAVVNRPFPHVFPFLLHLRWPTRDTRMALPRHHRIRLL